MISRRTRATNSRKVETALFLLMCLLSLRDRIEFEIQRSEAVLSGFGFSLSLSLSLSVCLTLSFYIDLV
jgi:hypothetical protein